LEALSTRAGGLAAIAWTNKKALPRDMHGSARMPIVFLSQPILADQYISQIATERTALIRGLITTAAAAATTAATVAAAAATAAATTVATTSAATTATPATTAIFARASFVDGERPAVVFGAVDASDRGLSFRVATHLDKAEAFAPAGVAIVDHFSTLNRPKLSKHLVKIRARNVETQIATI
jgi:hypothetical protein